MSERIKRPKLARTRPIRSLATLFGAAPAVSATRRDGAMTDVVARSVELGYRVIDEYVRQGQQAAKRLSDRSYGPAAMASDAQALAARMMPFATESMALWLELVRAASGGTMPWPTPSEAPAANGASPAAPQPAGPPPAPPLAHARLRVAVTSPYPTEVTLELRPEATSLRPVAHALRASGANGARLSDVAIESLDGGAFRLSIRVPVGQPAGTYEGAIVDEATSRPLGTVSVRISAA